MGFAVDRRAYLFYNSHTQTSATIALSHSQGDDNPFANSALSFDSCPAIHTTSKNPDTCDSRQVPQQQTHRNVSPQLKNNRGKHLAIKHPYRRPSQWTTSDTSKTRKLLDRAGEDPLMEEGEYDWLIDPVLAEERLVEQENKRLENFRNMTGNESDATEHPKDTEDNDYF